MAVATSSYTLGPVHPNTSPTARFETKPVPVVAEYRDADGRLRARHDTGGGYERIRSWESDPTKPGDGKTDVYVYVHRLCAVAWLFPDDHTAADILPLLDGVDVHHSAPEVDADAGFKDDNREACLSLREHGRHSEITQAEMRAFGEDAKDDAEGFEGSLDPDGCDACGEAADVRVRSADFDGERCLDCAKRASEGSPMEVV